MMNPKRRLALRMLSACRCLAELAGELEHGGHHTLALECRTFAEDVQDNAVRMMDELDAEKNREENDM